MNKYDYSACFSCLLWARWNFFDTSNEKCLGPGQFSSHFEQNLQFDVEHYVVKLPVKLHHESLPNNHENSVNLLKSLTSKLQNNTSFFTEYDKIIKNYIKEGIIETIQTHGAPCEIHYLPHRAVVCEKKDTTKVRIVSDASSKVRDEPSLNGSLHLDPCLSPAIYNILLRFCLGKVGLVSDVKQVFLNIVLGEKHRDYAFYCI